MLHNYEIGQTVYFPCGDNPDDVRSGTIVNIQQITITTKPLRVKTYLLVNVPARGGYMNVPKTYRPMDLFDSENACRRQIMVDNNEIELFDQYLEEITSIESLMKFIFTHDVSQRSDNLAYLAVLQKTEELLSIDLKSLLENIEV